jgi:hypothetical protein
VMPQRRDVQANYSDPVPQHRRCGTANFVLRFINAALIWRDSDSATRG